MSLAALAWLACAAPAFAESVTLFRVFLNDGTAIVSYGEYARVGDRARVLDADRRCRREQCRRSQSSRRQSAGVGGQLDRDREIRRVRAAHALHGEQRRVRLRGAGRRRRGDAERHRAGQGREGAAEHGGRCAPAPRDVAARSLRIPRRRRARRCSDCSTKRSPGCGLAAGETSFAIDLVATAPPRDPRDQVPMLQSANGGRGHHARDCRGEGHRHRRRSRLDSSRRHRRARQSAKRAARGLGAADAPVGAPHDRGRSADRESIRRVDHPPR